jgi:uncharacterized protein (TIGR02246 family)
MSDLISDSDQSAFVGILHKLERAWNAGDTAAFGAPMPENANFIAIRADHLRGRKEIIASHAKIFSTMYAGSRNQLSLDFCRSLREDVALVHARSVLEAPTGPLAGRHEALLSTVLLRDKGEWQITSFHITLVPQ